MRVATDVLEIAVYSFTTMTLLKEFTNGHGSRLSGCQGAVDEIDIDEIQLSLF